MPVPPMESSRRRNFWCGRMDMWRSLRRIRTLGSDRLSERISGDSLKLLYHVGVLRPFLLLPALASLVNAQSLQGTIDMHVHAAPDGAPRSIDAIDLARLAKSRGMRVLVFKNHKESTAALAYLVHKEVPGIEVFGGIGLDLEVGGLNAAAVEWMTKMTGGYGRVVWFPTYDAEAQVKRSGQNRPFVSVVKDGKVVPEATQVLDVAARHNPVFETGHSSPSEGLLLIREAKRVGVKSIVVTHALTNMGGPYRFRRCGKPPTWEPFLRWCGDEGTCCEKARRR